MIPILQQLYYKHMCRNNKENKETARSWGKGRENFSLHEMKVVQLCLTLCDPMEYTVHGILQARILEWVAFLFSRVSSQPRDRTQVSHIAGGPFTSWATLVCMAAINPNHSSRAKLCTPDAPYHVLSSQLHIRDASYLNHKSEYYFVPFSIIHLAAHENECMHFILSLSLKP